jgi:hypothetical protein
MNLIPNDTTIDALRKQFEVLQNMTGEQRLQIAFELSNNVRKLVEAGVKSRHPDYDERKVKLAVLRLTIGNKLFQQIFPDIKICL